MIGQKEFMILSALNRITLLPLKTKPLEIGQFVIEEQEQRTIIHCKRSSKFWIDTVYAFALGAGAAAFVTAMYLQTYYHEWIFWLLGTLFTVLSAAKICQGINLLRLCTRSLIVVDNTNHALTTRYPYGKPITLDCDDVNAIAVLPGAAKRSASNRQACIVVKTKDGAQRVVAVVQPQHYVDNNGKMQAKEVDEASQQLALLLSDKTGVPLACGNLERVPA